MRWPANRGEHVGQKVKGSFKHPVKHRSKSGGLQPETFMLPGIDVPPGIADDAVKYLSRTSDNLEHSAKNHGELVEWLAKRITRVSKENRDHHYKTFAEAYALYASMGHTESLRAAIIAAAKAQGIALASRKSILRLVIELHISYTTDADPKSVRRAAQQHSRDVKAVESLIRRGIPPSKVLELSRQPTEGLDSWVRRNSPASKSRDAQSNKNSNDEEKIENSPEINDAEIEKLPNSEQDNQQIGVFDRFCDNLANLSNRIVWGKMTKNGPLVITRVRLGQEFHEELRTLFKKYRLNE